MASEKGLKLKLSEEEIVTLDIIVHSTNYHKKNGCPEEIIEAGGK